MDTDKKKPTLREAYDAARKGEAYERKLAEADQAVNVVESKALLLGGVTVAGNLLIASIILPDDASSLMQIVAGLMSFAASYVMISIAWRMLRGNVYAKMYEDLDNQPADPDGVKRTRDERVFLASSFGHTKMFLIFTRCVIGRAKASYAEVTETVSSTDDPDVVEVGNTLSRVSDRFAKLEVMLEAQWSECPPDARDAPSTRDGLRDICQQLTVLNIQAVDCLTFIYRHYRL